MTQGYKIKVDADDFRNALKKSRGRLRKELKDGMVEIGATVVGASVKRCPRPGDPFGDGTNYQVTGWLARSIRYVVKDWKRCRVLAGAPGSYAKWVHNGRVGMPARPFLKKGLEDSTRDINIIIRKAINNSLAYIS